MHVLVVDDDEEFRIALREALEGLVRVSDVATPAEVMWLMERVPVDILICDVVLATATSGLEILETVRDHWPRVGRILVTGCSDELDHRELPAHAMLRKPCDLGALRDLIRLLPVLPPDASAVDLH